MNKLSNLFRQLYIWGLTHPKQVKSIGLYVLLGVLLLGILLTAYLFQSNKLNVLPLVNTGTGTTVSGEVSGTTTGTVMSPISSLLDQQEVEQKVLRGKLQNQDSLVQVIVSVLDTQTLTSELVSDINKYLSVKQLGSINVTCSETCTLDQKFKVYQQLSEITEKVQQEKAKALTGSLTQTKSCSEKDILTNYNNKTKLLKSVKVDLKGSLSQWDSSLNVPELNQTVNLIQQIKTEKTIVLTQSELLDLKTKPVVQKTVKLNGQSLNASYYNRNEQLFEKDIIDKYISTSIIPGQLVQYITVPVYIDFQDNKYKYYSIKLVTLDGKGVLDTLTYLLLSSSFETCDQMNFKFSDFGKDVTQNELVKQFILSTIQDKKKLDSSLTQDQVFSLQVRTKLLEKILNTVFIQ